VGLYPLILWFPYMLVTFMPVIATLRHNLRRGPATGAPSRRARWMLLPRASTAVSPGDAP